MLWPCSPISSDKSFPVEYAILTRKSPYRGSNGANYRTLQGFLRAWGDRGNQYKWHSSHYGYAVRAVCKRRDDGRRTSVNIHMHKVVCPAPDGMIVDHINRKCHDNRSANLRVATQKQNEWNRKFVKQGGRSRYNGIRWDKNREEWQVRLTVDGRRESFGYYADELEAAKTYDRAAKKHRGEFAYLNFPTK